MKEFESLKIELQTIYNQHLYAVAIIKDVIENPLINLDDLYNTTFDKWEQSAKFIVVELWNNESCLISIKLEINQLKLTQIVELLKEFLNK